MFFSFFTIIYKMLKSNFFKKNKKNNHILVRIFYFSSFLNAPLKVKLFGNAFYLLLLAV
jgi:hypothetical protein